MYKLIQILAIFLIWLNLTGCYPSSHNTSSKIAPPPNILVQETLPFDFIVPDGYVLSFESDKSVIMTHENQVIGGIRLTDLQEECLEDSKCRHLHEYLSIFAPYPSFKFEYISQLGDNESFISLKVTEVETGSVYEQSHHLFEKDAAFYDFWVDTSVVSSEDRDTIFKSIKEES